MTLWIPPTAISREGHRYTCMSCGLDGADQDHVIACSQKHADIEHDLVRSALGRDGSYFNGLPVDEELEAWVEQYRKPLIRGDMKI